MEKQEPLSADTSGLPGNGQAKPAQLSSNTTLLWRIFLPVFGTVFLTGLLLAFWLTDEDDLYLPYPVIWPRSILVVLWLGWLWYIWRYLWPLKRLDATDTHLFVTNYWTTVRYPWSDVEGISDKKLGRRSVAALRLKAPGRFGQEILFIPGTHYQTWMEEHEKQHLLLAN